MTAKKFKYFQGFPGLVRALRLVPKAKWQEVLVKDRPDQRILADTCGTRRRAQDSFRDS